MMHPSTDPTRAEVDPHTLKQWLHDGAQILALQRSGIAEIRRSTALSPVHRAVLVGHLRRRVYGRHLPAGVKRVFGRLGL